MTLPRAVLVHLLAVLAAGVAGVAPAAAAPATGTVAGVVHDDDGVPVGGAAGCVYLEQPDRYDTTRTATPDAAGRFRFDDVPPGAYRVDARDCDVDDDRDLFQEVLSTTVVPGQDVEGLDVTMRLGTSIRGTVTALRNAGTPCTATVRTPEGRYVGYAGIRSETGGTYVTYPLEPGEYIVSFESCSEHPSMLQWWPQEDRQEDAQVITVRRGVPARGIDGVLHPGAHLEGRAFDLDGAPITSGDICVWMQQVDGDGSAYAQTDATGRWSADRLRAGTYDVVYTPCTGSSRTELVTHLGGSATRADARLVTLGQDEARDHQDVRMRRAASISGRVTAAETGSPIAGACVATAGRSVSSFAQARTDADGHYVLTRLEEDPRGYSVAATDCSGAGHAPQVLGATADDSWGTAVPTSVASPATDVDLALAPGARVEGTIRDATGAPVRTQDVCVDVTGGPALPYWLPSPDRRAELDADGRWSVGVLAAGTYGLRTTPCGADSRNDLPAVVPAAATVAAGQVASGLDVRLKPATTITGRITAAADGRPVAGACVGAQLPDRRYGRGDSVTADADGRYVLGHLRPGERYVVSAGACTGPSDLVQQYVSGTADASTAAQVTAPATGVDVALTSGVPETTIVHGPSPDEPTTSTRATIVADADGYADAFTCSVDGAPSSPCSQGTLRLTGLAVGPHVVLVRASRGGQADPTPAAWRWTVASTGREVTAGGTVPAGDVWRSDAGAQGEYLGAVVRVSPTRAATVTASRSGSAGYLALGHPFDVAAHPVTGTADPGPYRVVVGLVRSEAPDRPADRIGVALDGSTLATCASADAAGPCLESRFDDPQGPLQLAVRTPRLGSFGAVLLGSAQPAPDAGDPPPDVIDPRGPDAGAAGAPAAPVAAGRPSAPSAPTTPEDPAAEAAWDVVANAHADVLAPAPAVLAAPSTSGPAAPGRAPRSDRVRVTASPRRLATAVRRGLRLGLAADVRRTVEVRVTPDAGTRRALGRAAGRAGVVRRLAVGTRATTLDVRLPAAAGTALRRLRTARFLVSARGVDGGPTTALAVTVRR